MLVSTLGKRFDSSNFNEKDEVALFTLSYASSSAIRISTIFEAIGLKPPAKELYNKGIKSSDRVNFLCHYLRDNVCHREPAPGENFEDRQKYLDSLTIKEILENTLKQITLCFQEVKNLSDTLGNIGTDTRILAKMREAVG